MAVYGLTDAQIADFLCVPVDTYHRWKSRHREFREAIRRGKECADTDVAVALYNRARGYSQPAEKIFNSPTGIVRVEYVEHFPPDTNAAKFWLANRHLSTAEQNQAIRRRDSRPVRLSFDLKIAFLFGLGGPLLRPGPRSWRPARAAAVKEARRAPRSGAQRPGRPGARRHTGGSNGTIAPSRAHLHSWRLPGRFGPKGLRSSF
jgi:hypothetical protein